MNASSSSNLYSHPDKLLEDHLINVADIACQNVITGSVTNIGQYDKSTLIRLIKVCGLCHDIGKATGFFKDTYLPPNKKRKTERHE